MTPHTMTAASPSYFNDMMIDRQLLFWTIATRRELERWEARVAEIIRLGLQSTSLPGLEGVRNPNHLRSATGSPLSASESAAARTR